MAVDNQALFIGLMSGTSADGVDVAIVDFSGHRPSLVNQAFTPYPDHLKQQIVSLYTPGENEIDRLGALDRTVGVFYGQCVNQLLKQSKIKAHAITAIGCHGQTLRHRPKPQYKNPFTLQIGCPNTLAEATGIQVVADFRRRDIAAGGQGAPLAPGFHNAVFTHSEENRAVLNIGGVANITLLQPGKSVVGFDTGPGNGLMDAWIHRSLSKPYDENGGWAASGSVNSDLLSTWLEHPYFTFAAPKSTGREEFSLKWLLESLKDFSDLAAQDVQATLLQLTVDSIAQAIPQITHTVYVCGGGANNGQLMQQLQTQLPHTHVTTTEALGVAPEWVEAMAFAWLAYQCLHNLPGNVPSVTGAKKTVVLGGIYPSGAPLT